MTCSHDGMAGDKPNGEDPSKFVTTCDMRAGFNNLPVSREFQRNLAFFWRGKIYVCTRMCFGHRNAPAMYQRIMDDKAQLVGECSDWEDWWEWNEINSRQRAGMLQLLRAREVDGSDLIEYNCTNVDKVRDILQQIG